MAQNKEAVCNVGAEEDAGSIPGWGRSTGGGHRNPLQYSCQENSMHRGAWWTTVYWVAKSLTQLKRLSTHTLIIDFQYCFSFSIFF